MSNEIKAGVTVMQEFCRPLDKKFQAYIEYMDREEVKRNQKWLDYSLFANYNEYMGNPKKTTSLFTIDKDFLAEDEKRALKRIFTQAQAKGSVMWQTVISYDNRWLEEQGILNKDKQFVDEHKIKSVARQGISRMLKNENLENAVWSASIHYNTDNLHVHVAIVEPLPMRQTKWYVQYTTEKQGDRKIKKPIVDKNGMPVMKEEYVGRFKGKSIESCKSAIVNELLQTKEINKKINEIIRERIVEKNQERVILGDKELRNKFLQLNKMLPENIPYNLFNYNTGIMKSYVPVIDEISKQYVERYHKDSYDELKKILYSQQEAYKKAYGNIGRSFGETKLDELYARMGNEILKGIKNYRGEMAKRQVETQKPENKVVSVTAKREERRNFEGAEKEMLKADTRFMSRLEKTQNIELASEDKMIAETEESDYVPEQALKWLTIHADEAKIEKAAYALGQVYIDPEREFYNLEKGHFYLRQVCEENEYAAYKLGKVYTDPKLDIYDLEKGLYYFEKAYEKGNVYGGYQLGRLYIDSTLPVYDLKKGVEYLEEARQNGTETATYLLGKIYLDKESPAYDPGKGMSYMVELAEKDNGYAQFALGMEYLKGDSVTRSETTARDWFIKSAAGGNEYATRMLIELSRPKERQEKSMSIYSTLDRTLMELRRSFEREYAETYKNLREYELSVSIEYQLELPG